MGSAIPEGKESTSMLQQYTEWELAYVASAFHPAVEHDKTGLLFFQQLPQEAGGTVTIGTDKGNPPVSLPLE